MIYPHSELLFPHRYTSALLGSRGLKWDKLIESICKLPEDHEDSLGLCLLMVELCGCLKCDLNSYKASLGCRACARRALGSFKGDDEALCRRFEEARERVTAAMKGEAELVLLEEI